MLLSTEHASGVWKTLGGKWQGACWAPELALTHESEPFHERQVGMVVRTADQSQPDPNLNLSPDPTVDYQCVYLGLPSHCSVPQFLLVQYGDASGTHCTGKVFRIALCWL